MANVSSNWQDSLNPRLVNRLTRPLRQPGMMNMGMSQRIINRCDRFLNRLPLLNQQMQRWGNTNTLSSDDIPIVYAQPVSFVKEQEVGARGHNSPATVSQNQPSVPRIQRKVDDSPDVPVQTYNNSINFQNSTNFSSSNFSDETTLSFSDETQINQISNSSESIPTDEITTINQTSISSEAIPTVSPQPISEELDTTTEIPLQAKFSDTKTASANPSQLNANSPSLSNPDEITSINQTSISSETIPTVSPQTISEELDNTKEIPLQAKFSDSQTSSATSSGLNTNSPSLSNTDEITTINQTSISSEAMPTVSSQPISEELNTTREMPLQAKVSDSQITSANPSQLNTNSPSLSNPDEINSINQTSISSESIPRVSPQTISEELNTTTEMPLQAKFSDTKTASANPSQLNTNIPSLSNPDEINSINQTSISSETMPRVSPQPISEELDTTVEMPIQAKFSDSKTDSANPSALNVNTPSLSNTDEITTINQTSISSESIPRVSPQAISEKLDNTGEMPLQAKFSDNKTASANPSVLNTNTPSLSNPDEITTINQTSISSEAMPRVSPQAISEELDTTTEMPLQAKFSDNKTASAKVQEFSSTSQQTLPIIKAKKTNSSLSLSSIPIVNPSDTLVTSKQTQLDNYAAEKSRSINSYNSKIQISSKEFPIVTVQPLTYQINSTKEEDKNTTNNQSQFNNLSKLPINQSNSDQNMTPLPIVPVTSQVHSSLQTQSLPLSLANNTPISNSISQKLNLSSQNGKVSNTDASSSPKIIASSSSPTQTFVSAMETQPKIDLDAITSKVERKIMRRLVIERERRGKIR